MKRSLFVLASLALLAVFTALPAQPQPPPAPDKAKQDIEKLIKANEELQKQIDALKKQPQPMPPGPAGPMPPPEPGRGYIPPTPAQKAVLHAKAKAANGNRLGALAKLQTLPAAFDCRKNGWALPVGDQGNCGSCYLYSTALTASSAYVKAGYGKPDNFLLAIQYGMDCHNFGGCNGGYGLEVIDWMVDNGFPAEYYTDESGTVHNDYPTYEARARSCRKVPNAKYWKPAGWGFCTSDQSNRKPTTQEIKTAMFNYGMLNVAVDAGGQFSNGTGTITSLGRNIDHEINVVAYDDAKGTFLLQNQWNKGWGNNGYREVTYAAAANLVDWFWVNVDPLTPPPDTQVVVPSLIGSFYSVAKAKCSSLGLGINPATAEGSAVVTAQYPDAGIKVDAGFTVPVTLDNGPTPPPIGGDIVITVPAGSPGGKYTVISDTDKASIAAKIEEICQMLKPGPEPVTARVPLIAPQKWVRDAKVAAQLAKAMEKQQGGAEAYKKLTAADPTAHPMLMRSLWRKMRADPQGEKILAAYMKSAEKPAGDSDGGGDEVGTPFTDILDWIIKNGPAILSLVMTIIGLFG